MEDNVIANFEEVKKAFTELIEEVMRENAKIAAEKRKRRQDGKRHKAKI